ncbi:MAG: hypothetical protein IAE65_01710 [Ignavibacteria bacterium]|nr:hypothetical protein [Ignavibacteria bacterium]
MPRSTIGGDDPFHDLSSDEKDKIELEFRNISKNLRKIGKFKEANKKEARAVEISRRKSGKSQHH